MEDLRLGTRGGATTFWSVSDVAVAGDRLFVGDTRSREIYVFSLEGETLDTLGRPGDGPGEFQRVSIVSLIEGRLVVTDHQQRRWTYFSLGGELLGTRRVPHVAFDSPWRPAGIAPAVRGKGIVVPGIPTNLVAEHPVRPRYLIDSLGAIVDTLPPDPVGERLLYVEYEGGAALSTRRPLYLGSRGNLSQNGRFWGFGRPIAGGVALSLWDLATGSRYDEVVERSATPVPGAWADSVREVFHEWLGSQGRASRSDFDDALKLPDVVQLDRLFVMGDGSIWFNRPTFAGDRERWDVVDVVQGERETADLPRGLDPLARSGDHVWSRFRDALGVHYVVRLILQPRGK